MIMPIVDKKKLAVVKNIRFYPGMNYIKDEYFKQMKDLIDDYVKQKRMEVIESKTGNKKTTDFREMSPELMRHVIEETYSLGTLKTLRAQTDRADILKEISDRADEIKNHGVKEPDFVI